MGPPPDVRQGGDRLVYALAVPHQRAYVQRVWQVQRLPAKSGWRRRYLQQVRVVLVPTLVVKYYRTMSGGSSGSKPRSASHTDNCSSVG